MGPAHLLSVPSGSAVRDGLSVAQPAKGGRLACWEQNQRPTGNILSERTQSPPSGSVPKHSGEEELGVSSLGIEG